MLVQYKADIVLIIFIVTCSRHDIAKNKWSFDVKQQALTQNTILIINHEHSWIVVCKIKIMMIPFAGVDVYSSNSVWFSRTVDNLATSILTIKFFRWSVAAVSFTALLVPGEAVKPRIYKIITKMCSKNTLDMFSWCLCGRRGRDRMVVEFTTTCTTIAYSSTKVVSSNPADGEVYSIQHNVIKLVSDLRQVDGFFGILRFPPLIKLTSTI